MIRIAFIFIGVSDFYGIEQSVVTKSSNKSNGDNLILEATEYSPKPSNTITIR